jgi:hypothetical protein
VIEDAGLDELGGAVEEGLEGEGGVAEQGESAAFAECGRAVLGEGEELAHEIISSIDFHDYYQRGSCWGTGSFSWLGLEPLSMWVSSSRVYFSRLVISWLSDSMAATRW